MGREGEDRTEGEGRGLRVVGGHTGEVYSSYYAELNGVITYSFAEGGVIIKYLASHLQVFL